MNGQFDRIVFVLSTGRFVSGAFWFVGGQTSIQAHQKITNSTKLTERKRT